MRRGIRLGLAASATSLACLAGTFVPFVGPQTGRPVRADAVIVLSGDHGERLAKAMELLDQGVTSTLVLAGTPDSQRTIELCREAQRFEVVCLRPMPDNTRGEAQAAALLAGDRGWKHVVVSTSTFHVTRSALLFRRCMDAEVSMVGGDPPYAGRRMARVIVREWLAVGQALTFARTC